MPKVAIAGDDPGGPPRRLTKPGTRAGRTRPDAVGRAASSRAAGVDAPTSTEILVEGVGAAAISIPRSDALVAAAEEWPRIVLNRIRWSSEDSARKAQASRSRDLLQSLGVDIDRLQRMASGGILQVSIPYVREGLGWEARIFPWEYVLTSAVHDYCARTPLVIRHLDRRVGRSHRETADPSTAIIIESAPGSIRARYRFDSERRLVRAALGDGVQVVPDPTRRQVEEAIGNVHPGTIHLAGVDTHQGTSLLSLPDPGFDGYLLASGRLEPEALRAEALAKTLKVGSRAPAMVSCNFEHSAARTAALIVAEGAGAAIGFQDVVDDALAELFFSRFYTNWRELEWNTAEAFARTVDDLRTRPGVLTGLGIVLWSAADLVANGAAARISEAGRAIAATPMDSVAERPVSIAEDQTRVASSGLASSAGEGGVIVSDVPLTSAPGTRTTTEAPPGETPPGTDVPPAHGGRSRPRLIAGRLADVYAPPALWVEPDVFPIVNYVHLHNNGSLFRNFRLRMSSNEPVSGVEVEVRLFVGRHSFPYRATLELRQPVTELRNQIRVPLTSDLLRTIHEAVRSVVYVRVRHGNQVLYENTLPVLISSAEEWVDTEEETRWLPSFVLPRDPVVDELRRRALPSLRLLDDQFGGGFLGYQGSDEVDWHRVENQAKAIWGTLAFEYGLSYINPPPTYAGHAQRLRTPSEVVGSRSGTCIDLALLFAACLELIDIYPVIVMYEGHANVGYWRSRPAHAQFETLGEPLGKPPAGTSAQAAARPQQRQGAREAQEQPWEVMRARDDQGNLVADDPNLLEVERRSARQDLAILDATLLTQQGAFGDALTAGSDGFRTHMFRSLVDIRIARSQQVTPLPIVFE